MLSTLHQIKEAIEKKLKHTIDNPPEEENFTFGEDSTQALRSAVLNLLQRYRLSKLEHDLQRVNDFIIYADENDEIAFKLGIPQNEFDALKFNYLRKPRTDGGYKR